MNCALLRGADLTVYRLVTLWRPTGQAAHRAHLGSLAVSREDRSFSKACSVFRVLYCSTDESSNAISNFLRWRAPSIMGSHIPKSIKRVSTDSRTIRKAC